MLSEDASPSISLITKAEFNDSNRDGIAQVGETMNYTFLLLRKYR